MGLQESELFRNRIAASRSGNRVQQPRLPHMLPSPELKTAIALGVSRSTNSSEAMLEFLESMQEARQCFMKAVGQFLAINMNRHFPSGKHLFPQDFVRDPAEQERTLECLPGLLTSKPCSRSKLLHRFPRSVQSEGWRSHRPRSPVATPEIRATDLRSELSPSAFAGEHPA